MRSVADGQGDARRRRRLTRSVKDSLRDLGTQLALLNHQVSGRVDLRGTDLECLDLVSRFGPVSPSALARRAGLHPATMTGVLDRLERGGWVSRERDPADRRAVVIRVARSRGAELLGLYADMNSAMDQVCAQYREEELELVAGFLRRTSDAGAAAAARLTRPAGEAGPAGPGS